MRIDNILYYCILSLLLGFYLGRAWTEHEVRAMQDSEPLIDTLYLGSDTISCWSKLQLAIAMTESEFKSDAVGKSKDYGIYQITPIYVQEVNRILGVNRFEHSQAFDVNKSVEMFNILQNYHNSGHDIDLAIYYHNKAPWYKKRVQENYKFVSRYESLREVLKFRELHHQ